MRATADHSVWREIAPEIRPSELNYATRMHVETLRRLSRVRRRSGVPFRFLSDHRPPTRNEDAGGATSSAHLADPCHAVDLRVHSSRERYLIVAVALAEGFTRIGVYPPTASQRERWGKNAGSVHLDDSPSHPAQVIWVSP